MGLLKQIAASLGSANQAPQISLTMGETWARGVAAVGVDHRPTANPDKKTAVAPQASSNQAVNLRSHKLLGFISYFGRANG